MSILDQATLAPAVVSTTAAGSSTTARFNYRELQTEPSPRSCLRHRHRYRGDLRPSPVEPAAHRFNGMWALVMYDATEGTLFASRDRFGVKPFYYAIAGDRFAFASEIKQLHAGGLGSGRADREQVARFLLHGEVNLSERTCVEGTAAQPGRRRWRVADGSVQFARPSGIAGATTAMRPGRWLDEYRQNSPGC
jgi:asparagine synthetase B (glutamine-hydrolysing)